MKQLLIVDADGTESLVQAFSQQGWSCEVTADMGHALEWARSNLPDLIVVNAELPDGSGYSVVNQLRRDARLREIPLVFTSSEASAQVFEQHRKLKTRADAYFTKPFSAEKVVEAIEELSSETAEARALRQESWGSTGTVGGGVGASPGTPLVPVVLALVVMLVTAVGIYFYMRSGG